MERNGKLPLLDVLIPKKPDGLLGHTVYSKPTHTDRYLNKNLNNYPKQKRGIVKRLVERKLKEYAKRSE